MTHLVCHDWLNFGSRATVLYRVLCFTPLCAESAGGRISREGGAMDNRHVPAATDGWPLGVAKVCRRTSGNTFEAGQLSRVGR